MSSEIKYFTKAEAQIVRERKQLVVDRELDKIYEKHETVTVDLVLEAAKQPKSPLHKYFDWDDRVAADKWRQTQALSLIMASKFITVLAPAEEALPSAPQQKHEVRRLVSAFRGEGFKMRKDVLDSAELRTALIEKYNERLLSWCRAVVDIEEFNDLRALILKRLDKR